MPDSFDEKVAKRLDEGAEKLLTVLEEATQAKKKVRIDTPCDKCSCKHIRMVEIEDHKTALQAAEFLANRGFGRPNAKEDDREAAGVTFVRKIEYVGDGADA